MELPGLLFGTSFLGGLSKRKAAYDSAASDADNAVDARVRGIFEERGLKLDQEALLSQIRNRAGAAGLDPNSGSPLEAYLQAAHETQLDILHARSNAAREVDAYRSRAIASRRAGDAALFGSALEGTGEVLKFNYLKEINAFKPSVGKG